MNPHRVTLTLSAEDAKLLRYVTQQHVNALAALDKPARGTSRLSAEGKSNLARLRAIIAVLP